MASYGQAKIQFLKNIDEIKALINKGLTRLQIYKTLKEQGKITAGQAWFYRFLKKHIPEEQLKSEVVRNFEKSQQIDLEDYLKRDNEALKTPEKVLETTKEEKVKVSEQTKAPSPTKKEETQEQVPAKDHALEVSASEKSKPIIPKFHYDPNSPIDMSRI